MSYIASNDNRLYAALEPSYGTVPDLSDGCRVPAVKLAVTQQTEQHRRRDKTGTRTFTGHPAGTRRHTRYTLDTYLATWTQAGEPGYGPLFRAGLGRAPLVSRAGTVASSNGVRVRLQAAHGLVAGQAIAIGGELRFVTAVVDALTVDVNAPFSSAVVAGAQATPTLTYRPGKELASVSLFDYWDPEGAVSRVLRGAAVDTIVFKINSDFHQFRFAGPGCDVTDNKTFTDGEGGVTEFPAEPQSLAFNYGIVPGHMGQVWLGASPERFYTLTDAEVTVTNHIESSMREFGSERMREVVAGDREVTADFELYAADDEQTIALYEAARHLAPVSVLFQLGQQEGHMCGVYLKNTTLETPVSDDSETRLRWRFSSCRAHGIGEDEIAVAFA